MGFSFMKLTEVVSRHGFAPSSLGEIQNAKLYERQNPDGVIELLCVQKIGNVMRIDRKPLIYMRGEPSVLFPIGEGVSNLIIPMEQVETFLNSTLAPAQF